MYNIKDYGAVADGVTLNTTAIQAAIDACSEAGGGRVIVPAGTWKSGTIWMKSNIELHLEAGATILASDNMDDYNDIDAFEQNHRVLASEGWVGKHLLIAHEIENVAITGFGTFDGNCYAFVDDAPTKYQGIWRYGITKLKDEEKMRPGQLLSFFECRHVRVHDITVHNSPCWSVYFLGCEHVSVRGIKVYNPMNMLNSDGIDIDTSRYVTVSDCIIITGDDGITLRCCEQRVKNKNIHCEFVTVTNCFICTSVCAFRIGVGNGIIRHARFSNLVIDKACIIMEFDTSFANKGCAFIEDINLSNVSCTDTDTLVYAIIRNNGAVRNVTMENIRCDVTGTTFLTNSANVGGILDNINLRNIELNVFSRSGGCPPDRVRLEAKNASRITLDNVKIFGNNPESKQVFVCEGCEDLVKKDCNF